MDTQRQQDTSAQDNSNQSAATHAGATSQPLALQQAQDAGPKGKIGSATDDMRLSEQDREWVDRTKAVIEHTKGDPYNQSREIAHIRNSFLEDRFGKHINSSEK